MSSSMHSRPASSLSRSTLPPGYASSPSSNTHDGSIRAPSGARSLSHHGERVNLAEVFADVNRALGPTRRSVPRGSAPQPIPPPDLRPRTLKKQQPPSSTRSILTSGEVHKRPEIASRAEEPSLRFSTASEPAYLRPPITPWQHLKVENRPRPASIEGKPRPQLKIVIPDGPVSRRSHRARNDILASRGLKSADPKDQAGCFIM